MNGDTIVNALRVQVLHYNIQTSLFDIVFVAVVRFIFLILFYGVFSINHWIVIAVNNNQIDSYAFIQMNDHIYFVYFNS